MPNVDPELEKTIVEYENMQKQLQVIVLQRHQLQLQLNEVKLASDELKKAKDDVYRSIGAVMIKSTKEDAEKDLIERKELIEIRVSAIEKQEEVLRTKLAELQKKVQEKMKVYEGGG